MDTQSVLAAKTILEVLRLAILSVSLVPIVLKIKLVTIKNVLILVLGLVDLMRNAKLSTIVQFVAVLPTLREILSFDATKKKVRRTEIYNSALEIYRITISFNRNSNIKRA